MKWLGPEFRGRDGIHLAVMTPGGPWYVGGRPPVLGLDWKRIGKPPNVTVGPSMGVSVGDVLHLETVQAVKIQATRGRRHGVTVYGCISSPAPIGERG